MSAMLGHDVMETTAKPKPSARGRRAKEQPELNVPLLPTETAQKIVQLFKLLADETRLQILHFLIQQPELNVGTLCELLQQSQPAVSHHLALLRLHGLITMRRAGKHNYYRLEPVAFRDFFDLVVEAAPNKARKIRFEGRTLSYLNDDETKPEA